MINYWEIRSLTFIKMRNRGIIIFSVYRQNDPTNKFIVCRICNIWKPFIILFQIINIFFFYVIKPEQNNHPNIKEGLPLTALRELEFTLSAVRHRELKLSISGEATRELKLVISATTTVKLIRTNSICHQYGT